MSVIIALLLSTKVFAASCCGGSAGLPAFITNDEKALISTSISYSDVYTRVNQNGYWLGDSLQESAQQFQIHSAYAWQDLWQSGVSLPWFRKEQRQQNVEATRLGDVQLHTAYEFLPELEYSAWKPKGFVFVQWQIPTGKSIYEDDSSNSVSTTGRGYHGLGVGTLFLKNFKKWDVQIETYAQKNFARRLYNPSLQEKVKLSPGWNYLQSLQGGYAFKDYHVAAGLMWSYEEAVRSKGSFTSETAPRRFVTTTLEASHPWNEEWLTTVSYSDDSLIGNASNVNLNRSLQVSLTRKFLR